MLLQAKDVFAVRDQLNVAGKDATPEPSPTAGF